MDYYVPSYEVKVGHIADVQELRKTEPTKIPERFVKDMADRPNLAAIVSSPDEIPIIDLSKLMESDNQDEQIMQLKTACEEWGFFQVVNHGIDLESIEKVSKGFFMLPSEEKQKYSMAPGDFQGYGQAFVFSEDQKLDWCNMFGLGIYPPVLRNPKFWPSKPAQFGETLDVYSMEIRKLCKDLLKYIAVSLGLKGNVFEEMFGESVQAIRMNYYPPCSRPDLVLGLSPHSDGSAITVLQQSKDCPAGLEVLKDQTWVSVRPIPNALVINLGDSIEVLTNGRYKSAEHRAVTHEEKDRLSIVTFYAPSYETELGPMAELVDDQKNPCIYRRFNHGDYSRYYLTKKLQGKRISDFARIETKTTTA